LFHSSMPPVRNKDRAICGRDGQTRRILKHPPR
jgi:hypothetical protein